MLKSKKNFLNYMIELVVIIAGITISFIVEDYRENLKDHREYRTYLTKLKSDLIFDSLFHSNASIFRNTQYSDAKELYDILYKNLAIENDSAFVIMTANVMRTRPISFNDKTFQELHSTGAYKLIEDDTIRYALIYYYNNPSVSVWNNTIDDRNNKALHYIVKHAPLKLYFMNDSLFENESIDYESVSQSLFTNLRKEEEFEGLLKNSIRTISELNKLERELLYLNQEILNRIDSLLNI